MCVGICSSLGSEQLKKSGHFVFLGFIVVAFLSSECWREREREREGKGGRICTAEDERG